jgi:protein-S-isoprenylcysteine O-methyltransferase Ste14/uncharacterized membrane protein (UPF0127 family)
VSDASFHRVTVAGSGAVVADRVRPAHTHWARLRGLLGTAGLGDGEGLWLRPCRQVHMIGMRYAVDVAFLDDDLRVVQTVSGLRPGTVSPKVAGATSVLELPAERLHVLGVSPGTRLAIDPSGRRQSSTMDGLAAALVNVTIAAFFAFFASAHFAAGWRTGEWATLGPIMLQESMLMMFFLTRRRSTEVTTDPVAWVVGIVGMLMPMLFRPGEPSAWVAIGAPLQVLGLVLVLLSVGSLGRSIGVVPAHRGLKTAGMYAFVRHPIYAAHLISYSGYLLCYPTPANLLIGAVTLVALNLRAVFEERLLARDPDYADYLGRVAWRFLPRIY